MTAQIGRIPATCAAIRRAQAAALDIALEADADGRHGIARALRRKCSSTRPADWEIVHRARRVEARLRVSIGDGGVVATGTMTAREPAPADVAASTAAALRLVMREAVR